MPASPLIQALQRYGPLPARRLRELLGASQSSFQRDTSALAERLIRIGKARATRWAARREIDGLHTPIPVYEVDSTGAVALLTTLHPVAPFGHAVLPAAPHEAPHFVQADPSQLPAAQSLDLPWLLQDSKPEGYMGRAWLSRHPALGYPTDLTRWTGDHVLRYLAHHGEQAPGALLVGAAARVRFEEQAPAVPIPAHQVTDHYAERASSEVLAAPAGSSAGGEQPKFTARVEGEQGELFDAIVKFTAPMSNPAGRRWADLLTAEHLAHEALRAAGIASCTSRTLDADCRRFLEVVRFDRHGSRGRSGVVSLHPFDPEGVASNLRSWSLVSASLLAQGRLSAEDHATVQWLEAFGHLIANTDMHLGNLSLTHRQGHITGLAPVYDMLPMFHAPRQTGEVVDALYDPWKRLSNPPASAVAAARSYWATVAAAPAVSERFQAVAEAQLGLL